MTAVPITIKISEPKLVNIIAYRGDSGRFLLTVKDADDTPYDLTGMDWDADIRENKNDEDPLTSFVVVPVIGEINKVYITLPRDNARLLIKKCYYDIEMSSDSTNATTLIYGKILAGEDVSRA